MHGKTSIINNLGSKIFKGLPKTFTATRYHSLIIKNKTISNDFKIIATTKDNNDEVIMGIEHKNYPCFGVQFHPESIASHPYGKNCKKLFDNLMNSISKYTSLIEEHGLNEDETSAGDIIMDGGSELNDLISFLETLNKYGINQDHVLGAVKVMRDKMVAQGIFQMNQLIHAELEEMENSPLIFQLQLLLFYLH